MQIQNDTMSSIFSDMVLSNEDMDMDSSPPSPSHSPSFDDSSYSDNVDFSGTFGTMTDKDVANEIDNFASLLLPTTSSSISISPSWTKKMDQWYPLKPTTSAKFTFDELNTMDVLDVLDSFSLFDPRWNGGNAIKPEKPLPLVTSSSSLEHTSTSLTSTTSLKVPTLEVPTIPQPDPLDLSCAFFPQEIPTQPGMFLGMNRQKVQSKVTKRKRQNVIPDEVCATDGVLFNVIMDACKRNKVPSLEIDETNLNQQKLISKKHRYDAKLKLDQKKRTRKLNFSGHYPQRKAVASSRKRVGGRFVKEKKSVFRPVKTQTS